MRGKNFTVSLAIMLIGGAIFVCAGLWGAQTGYDHPNPSRRDANIGAGLLAFFGFQMAVAGLVVLIVQLAAMRRK